MGWSQQSWLSSQTTDSDHFGPFSTMGVTTGRRLASCVGSKAESTKWQQSCWWEWGQTRSTGLEPGVVLSWYRGEEVCPGVSPMCESRRVSAEVTAKGIRWPPHQHPNRGWIKGKRWRRHQRTKKCLPCVQSDWREPRVEELRSWAWLSTARVQGRPDVLGGNNCSF